MHRRDHHGDPAEALFASLDWSTTPLGPADGWDDTLLAAVDRLTHTQLPATLFWGPEYVLIYNAAYAPMIGDKHPAALGSGARDVFPEAWDLIGPMLETVLHGGPSSWVENQCVPLRRRGFLEECYFTFSYSAVRAPDGTVEGVIDFVTETTGQVLSSRRLSLLSDLAQSLVDVDRMEDVTTIALAVLRRATRDFMSVDIAEAPRAAGAGESMTRDAQGQVGYLPAAEQAQIGGDWYDLFELPDGTMMVAIGDVAGHDQAAPAAMAQARNMLRSVAFTLAPAPPGRMLAALDRAMSASESGLIATAVLARVTRDGMGPPMLEWSNAGHPPPLLIAEDGSVQLLQHDPNVLLGLNSSPRDDHSVPLPEGSTIVLYTDGLVERRNADLTDGLNWLKDTLRDRQDLSVDDLMSLLLTQVEDAEDDVALLILRT